MKTPAAAARPARSPEKPSVLCEPLEGRRHLSADVTVSTARAQTVDGFGTSLGGVTSLSLVKTPAFQKAYYRDLGASVFRVALNPWILAGDTPNGKKSIGVPVPMGPRLAENIKSFDFYNPNIQKYGMMARAAKKYGSEVAIIGSFWTPPFWMKGEEINPSTGRPNGNMPTFDDQSGNTAGGTLIDSDANFVQFGRYVAAYVAGFQQAFGVQLDGISIQNELAFRQPYSSAVYDPKLYVKAVKAVDRWLREYGLTTKIIGPEDVGVGSTQDTGILNRQMAYVKALRNDKDALAAVDVYAIHGYAEDGVTHQRSPEMWGRYWNGQDGTNSYNTFEGIKADGKKSWMTEVSGFANTWNATMRFVAGIQDSLTEGNVSAYVYWGITNSSDNGEALMVNDDYDANKYNAFKHFAKYVRPGSVRLETTGDNTNGVQVSAFADDATRTLTSVLVNSSTEAQTVTLRLGDTGVAKFGTAFASTEAFTWKALRSYTVRGGRVTLQMPARSIFTLVGSTARPAAVVAAPAGRIAGVYFDDRNANGRQDTGDAGLAGDKVFLDMNANGTRDRREPTVVTAADGSYTFTGLPAGVFRVRREVVAGYRITTEPTATKLRKGNLSAEGVSLGVAKTATTPAPAKGASISGHAFADSDKNGRQNGTEPDAAGKLIFLDANANGRADAGETQTSTDSNGDFRFAGLASGTYRVRRAFPTGFRSSTPIVDLTLLANEQETGVLLGSRLI